MTETDHLQEQKDIAASVKGDGGAYRRLVIRYQNQIAGRMRYFSRDPWVLEELVQEVFVEAYFSLKGFRGKAPFLHWLMRIATRAGYRYWKIQSRKRDRETELPEDLPDLSLEPESLTRFEAADALFRVFARLAPEDRLVLTLFYFEDCETLEIAAQTGWSRTGVKVRLYRARNRLKSILGQENNLGEME